MKNSFLLFSLFMALFANAQTKIIAHRGFWKTNPETTENSIQALKNAQNLGAFGSEFDVRMSKDGVLVINHDEKHKDLEVSETLFADLRKLPLSNGELIPTLEEYLTQGKKNNKVRMILEIKPAKSPELESQMVQKALAAVKKFKMEKQVDYISFSIHICKELRKLDKKAHIQYLMGDISPEEVKALGLSGIDYHYAILLVKNPDFIARAKKIGLKTNAWTVNDEPTLNSLIKQGLDMVTTNTPDVFMKAVSEK